jgi:hypothetical protein
VGRPTKLTPELTERVCRYLRAGAFIESAALGCGITRQTFYLWMRTGNAARDDRLAHSQRGVGILMLTPDEERCVEFLEAMEEALSVAENRCVCGIVEAGERDWRAWAWRADRRTRLPHGYRACGEWDQGANESTLHGIRERNAAREAWTRKMSARVAAMGAAGAEGEKESGARSQEGSGSAVAPAELWRDKLPNERSESDQKSEVGGQTAIQNPGVGSPEPMSHPRSPQAHSTNSGSTGSPEAGLVSKMVKKPLRQAQGGSGAFLASVVLLLGLWLMGAARGFAADESGFQPWKFGRRGSWAVGPGWDEGAPLALADKAVAEGGRESGVRSQEPGVGRGARQDVIASIWWTGGRTAELFIKLA